MIGIIRLFTEIRSYASGFHLQLLYLSARNYLCLSLCLSLHVTFFCPILYSRRLKFKQFSNIYEFTAMSVLFAIARLGHSSSTTATEHGYQLRCLRAPHPVAKVNLFTVVCARPGYTEDSDTTMPESNRVYYPLRKIMLYMCATD